MLVLYFFSYFVYLFIYFSIVFICVKFDLNYPNKVILSFILFILLFTFFVLTNYGSFNKRIGLW